MSMAPKRKRSASETSLGPHKLRREAQEMSATIEPSTALTLEQLKPAISNAPLFTVLPREIRDQIYDHLWKATPKIRQYHWGGHFTVTYDMTSLPLESNHQHDTVSWLLTSKQMMDEGMFQFHQKPTWHITDTDYDRLPVVNTEHEFPLNVPSLAAKYHFNLVHQPMTDQSGWRIWSLSCHRPIMFWLNYMSDTEDRKSPLISFHVTIWQAHESNPPFPGGPERCYEYKYYQCLYQFDKFLIHDELQKFHLRVVFDRYDQGVKLHERIQLESQFWRRIIPNWSKYAEQLVPKGVEVRSNDGVESKGKYHPYFHDNLKLAVRPLSCWTLVRSKENVSRAVQDDGELENPDVEGMAASAPVAG